MKRQDHRPVDEAREAAQQEARRLAEPAGASASVGRAGLVPLVVPVNLLQHHIRRSGIDYLAAQSYLAPHPRELVLRNHV